MGLVSSRLPPWPKGLAMNSIIAVRAGTSIVNITEIRLVVGILHAIAEVAMVLSGQSPAGLAVLC